MEAFMFSMFGMFNMHVCVCMHACMHVCMGHPPHNHIHPTPIHTSAIPWGDPQNQLKFDNT